MNRRSLLSTVLGMIAAFVVITAGAATASAQNPFCCEYILNTSNVDPACFPIAVSTAWIAAPSHTHVATAPGFESVPLPGPCPPAPQFNGAVLTSAAGCCLTWTHYYCGGCLFIEVVNC